MQHWDWLNITLNTISLCNPKNVMVVFHAKNWMHYSCKNGTAMLHKTLNCSVTPNLKTYVSHKGWSCNVSL